MEKNDLRTLSSDWYFFKRTTDKRIPGSFLTESKTIKLTYVEEEGICGEHGTKA
jgi:hypothetical protein